MSVDSFIPQIWTARLLAALQSGELTDDAKRHGPGTGVAYARLSVASETQLAQQRPARA